jgi:hypothetical protein
MLRGRWGAKLARGKLEDGSELLIDIVSLCQSFTLFKWDPCACRSQRLSPRSEFFWRTLVFTISTLDLLVCLLLNLSLEDSRSGWLIETGGLEDVCRIDPIVSTAAHN